MTDTKISAAPNINSIQMVEQSSTPATPSTGLWRVYIKSDGLYLVDDAGAVFGPLSTPLDETVGGTGQSTVAPGDILYGSASNVISKLAAGTSGYWLKQGASIPAWAQHPWDRVFGADKPAASYYYTGRTFQINDFTNHKAGFEDSQSSPYSFGGSPGGFSLSTPASNFNADSNGQAHWLRLYNYHATTPLYVQWTNASALTNVRTYVAINIPNYAADYLVFEIRGWDVQTPGASDNYWALRFTYLGSTTPSQPLRVSMYYGTGTTFAIADGTLVGISAPVVMGMPLNTLMVAAAGPSGFTYVDMLEGFANFAQSTTVASFPVSFKTVRWYLPGGTLYQRVWLDQILVT